jgi:predicted  nucleic acid-binding Zn-ribbon protein
MSEDVDDTAAVLHAFGAETARVLKRAGTFAKDLLVLVEVYGEAQRLQGIVAKLTRDEVTLTAKLATVAEQHVTILQQLDSVNGQLANNAQLLEKARQGAQARIAAELDTWREQQLTARRQEIDGLMATREEESRTATAALQVVLAEVKDTAVVQDRLQAAVEILRQTRRDLVGEIAAAV